MVKPVYSLFLNFSIFVLTSLFPHPLLGAFAKFQKTTTNFAFSICPSVSQSVCPSVCFTVQNSSASTGRIFIKFQNFRTFRKYVRKIRVLIISDKVMGDLLYMKTYVHLSYFAQFFLNVKYRHISHTTSQPSLRRHSVIRIPFHYAKQSTDMRKPSYVNHTESQFPCH